MSGQSGNPVGKPRGARNKVTVAIESLMGKFGEQVAARVIKRARHGEFGIIESEQFEGGILRASGRPAPIRSNSSSHPEFSVSLLSAIV